MLDMSVYPVLRGLKRVVDIDYVLNEKTSTIKKLHEFYGDDFIQNLISLVSIEFCQNLNIKKENNLTPLQYQQLGDVIIDEYKYLTILDLILCFKLANNETFYNRVSINNIQEILNKYIETKTAETKRRKALREAEERKMERQQWAAQAVPMPESFKQAFIKVKKVEDADRVLIPPTHTLQIQAVCGIDFTGHERENEIIEIYLKLLEIGTPEAEQEFINFTKSI